MSVREAVNAYGSTLDSKFAGDRSKTIGASEIGLCARRVAWQKKELGGTTPSKKAAKSKTKPYARKTGDKRGAAQAPENWGAHVRGSTIEDVIWRPAMIARFGDDFKMHTPQVTLVSDCLSATPDGLVATRGRELLEPLGIKVPGSKPACVVVDCKSVDPRVNLAEEKAEHAFQVQVQMGLIRERTQHKPEYAILSYIDASFWHEVVEFAVKFDQDAYDAAKLRAARIMRAEPQDQRPEGWIAGGKECGWCPHYSKCCEMMHGKIPEVESTEDPQFKAEIEDLAKRALQIKGRENAAAKDYKDIQDQIRERLREKGVRKIPGVVNWYGVKGRVSWDVEAMVEVLRKKRVPVDQFATTGEATSQIAIDKKMAR